MVTPWWSGPYMYSILTHGPLDHGPLHFSLVRMTSTERGSAASASFRLWQLSAYSLRSPP